MKKSLALLVIAFLILAITVSSCSINTAEVEVAYLDYADGSESKDTLIIKNGKVALPRSPQRDSYEFDGWLVDGTLYKYPSSVAVSDGTTIRAKWTKLCTVTVKYGIDGIADNRETVRSGEEYTLPGSPEKENYVFSGWKIGEEEYAASSSVKITDDITVEAKWTLSEVHTVTVVYGIEAVDDDITYIKTGESFTVPFSLSRDGYIFDGWDVDGTTYKYPDSFIVMGDTTITAKWTKLRTVTVDYDIEGMSPVKASVKSGEKYTLPAAPGKDGYAFDGWTVGDTTYKALSEVDVEDGTTITAKWTKLLTVTIVYGTDYSHSTVTDTVKAGDSFTLPVSPQREGYEFDGWDVGEEDLHKYPYIIRVTEDRTISAKWTKLYTVTVKYGIDGLSDTTEYVREGGTYTLPTVPAKTGSTCSGWRVGSETKNIGETITVTGNTTVTASWTDKTMYNVTYSIGDEGSHYSFTICVYDGDTMEYLEKAYEREGCTIVWTLGGSSFDITTPIKHDYTGTNVITGTYTPIQFTVKFDSAGGSDVADEKVDYGTEVVKPENPTRTGYTFKGWTLDGKDYLFDTHVMADMTLTAVWEKNSYKVTFDSKGGSDIESKTVEYNTLIQEPADPTMEGSDFLYWVLDGNRFDFKKTTITKDITLEAKWQVKTFYVTFVSGNSSVKDPNTQTIEYGKLAYKPQISAPEGQALKGWLIKDTDTYFDFNTQIKQAYNLVADWGKTCTVTIKNYNSADTVLKTESVGEGTTYDVEDALGYKVKVCADSDNNTHLEKFTVDGDITLYVQKGDYLTYSVGDTGPAGGKIFYVNSDSSANWKYLEAALSDFDETYSILGDSSSLDSYSNDYDFGTGTSNTLYLKGNTNSAAAVCASYTYGGYSDWFLPSLAELQEMFKESSAVLGIHGVHASSSIVSGAGTKVYTVTDGPSTSSAALSDKLAVRAVRRF